MPLPHSRFDRNADVMLTYQGNTVGFMLAAVDESGRKSWRPSIAPMITPQVRQDSVSYSYVPPEMDVVCAFESFEGGAGVTDIADVTDVAPVVYNYCQGLDFTTPRRVYLAAKQNAANASTGGAVAAAPTGFWDGSLGFFLRAGAYIYKWDTSTATWVLKDDATGTFSGVAYTDFVEMNSKMYAARGNTADYKYTTDGTTWTAFTDTDNNYFKFQVRGISSGLAVLWGLKDLTNNGVVKNTTNGANGGVAWSAGDAVAHTSEAVGAFLECDDDLYVFTTGGIYRYTGTAQEVVWSGGRKMNRTTNGTIAFLAEDGRVYSPYGDRLIQANLTGSTVNGTELQAIFPTRAMAGSGELNGTITAITGDIEWLYVAIKNTAGNTYILRGHPDEGVWHTWLYLGANDCNAMQIVGTGTALSANPALFFGYGAACRYVILPRVNARPEDDTNYRFASSGTAYGPWMAVGTKQFHKLLSAGRVIAQQCSAGKPITLSYEVDDGTTTTLVSAIGNGVTETETGSSIKFQRVRWVVTMATDDDTVSPRLLGALFDTILLPPRKRVWEFDVELSPVTSLTNSDLRWDRAEQERFLMNMDDDIVTLLDRTGRSWSTRMSTVGASTGTLGTTQGDVETYHVVLTEIVESTAIGVQDELMLDQDAFDAGKVWG